MSSRSGKVENMDTEQCNNINAESEVPEKELDYYDSEKTAKDADDQKYPRPLDYMSYFKNKKVSVSTRNRGILVGTLKAFDLNTNLGMIINGRHEFIKGENVIMISLGETASFIIPNTHGGEEKTTSVQDIDD